MKKIIVKNLQGQETHSAKFETLEQANAWIEEQKILKSWGKPERWVLESEEDVSHALDFKEVISDKGEVLTMYKLPSEFEVVEEDITIELAKNQLIADGLARQSLGSQIIAKVYSINESKGLSAQDFSTMISDVNLERIERLLWTGSLRTAKMMIQALDDTYFSSQEKLEILEMLKAY